MATLTWLGHSAFLLNSDGGKRIYVDPFLTGNPKAPVTAKAPDRIDVIAITHGHSDHVGDAIELSKAFPDAQIVCQVELKSWLGRQGANVGQMPGLNKGGSTEIDGIRFTLVNAFHSSSSDDGEYLGEACGIVVRLENGRVVYFAGDTCVFGDMQLIGRLYAPNYAVLPIGDWFPMGPRKRPHSRSSFTETPLACVPCHWGTFPLATGTPEQLAAEAPNALIHRVEPGDTIELA